MNIGSILIEKKDSNYNIISFKNTPFFDIFIESLQFPFKSSFSAIYISTLDEYIQKHVFNIQLVEKLLLSLFNQIAILDKYSISISYLDLNDILVIDNKFFICNTHKFYLYDDEERLLITDIYDKNNTFLSPHFINNTSIPFYSHKNDFLYSLALIVIDCLQKSNIYLKNLSNEEILNYYNYFPISKTLKFCLNDDISKRLFIIF